MGLSRIYTLTILMVLGSSMVVKAQFFDPILDDKTYLDNIQKDVNEELEEAKSALMVQAKVVENVTRAYIAAKLKENVFSALRVIAENELSKAAVLNAQRPKSPKQETEDEDDDESTAKPTTPLTGLGTAVKVNQQVFQELNTALKGGSEVFEGLRVIPNQVFSFLGEAFKIIFSGGKPKPKKADAVDPAELLMDEPQDMQILGAVSLLARDATETPLLSSSENVVVAPVRHAPIRKPLKGGNGKGSKKGSYSDEDSAEDDAESINQDGRIINLFSLLGLGRKKTGAVASTKNETLSGFDEDSGSKRRGGSGNKPAKFNVEGFVKNFRKSVGELQAAVPDIYRGVREAYKLLETVRGVAERVEEYLGDAF